MKIEDFRKQEFKNTINHIVEEKMKSFTNDNKSRKNYSVYSKLKWNFDRRGNTKRIRFDMVEVQDCIAYIIVTERYDVKKDRQLDIVGYKELVEKRHLENRKNTIKYIKELKDGHYDNTPRFSDLRVRDNYIIELEKRLKEELTDEKIKIEVDEEVEEYQYNTREQISNLPIVFNDYQKLERKLKLSKINGEKIEIKDARKKIHIAEQKDHFEVGDNVYINWCDVTPYRYGVVTRVTKTQVTVDRLYPDNYGGNSKKYNIFRLSKRDGFHWNTDHQLLFKNNS